VANPQLEDGYTKIANELLEALSRSNLSPYESRVLWFVIRQTYGWKKKTDLISLSQIVKGTGIEKGNTSRALKSLILRQIVVRLDNKQLGFNKDYDSWLRKLSAETPPRSCEKLSAETPKLSAETPKKVVSRDTKKLSVETPPRSCEKLSAETPQKKEYKETIQKKGTVSIKRVKNEKETIEEFTQELRQRFPMLNFDVELEKFNLYWAEGGRTLKRPKLALLNWMTIAQRRAEREDIGGKVGRPDKTDGWKDWAEFASPGDAPESLRQQAREA
jgi:phage replication O-like protein O